jgi:hypothetical protein
MSLGEFDLISGLAGAEQLVDSFDLGHGDGISKNLSAPHGAVHGGVRPSGAGPAAPGAFSARLGDLRRHAARILRTQPPEAWRRTAVHSNSGLLTLRQLVLQAVRHLRHHLPFIAEKRAALGVGQP